MIKCSSTSSVVKDTRLVKLEGRLVSLDGDGDGSDGNGNGKSVLVLDRDIVVSSDSNDWLASGGASAGCGSVRVVGLGADTTVGLDPLEGVVHETTVASLVTVVIATHEHLLGERYKFAGRNGVGTLGRSSGREGPARTALSLIFNWCDGIFFRPVDRGGCGIHNFLGRKCMVNVLWATEVLVGVLETRVLGCEFFPRHVGEFIVTNLVGKTLGVSRLDEDVVGFPRGVLGIVLSVGVFFVEKFDPRLEASAGFDLWRMKKEKREKERRKKKWGQMNICF